MTKLYDSTDLRSDLEEAFKDGGQDDDVQDQDAAPAGDVNDEPPAEETPPADTETDEGDGRERDEHGRFKAKAKAPDEEGAESDGKEQPKKSEYSEEDETFLASLGDNRARVEAMLKEAGADYTLKSEQLTQREQALSALEQFQGIDQAIQPILPLAQQHGATPVEAIEVMAKVHSFADQNPAAFADWWLKTGRVNPLELPAVQEAMKAAGYGQQKPKSGDDWDDWDDEPKDNQEIAALKQTIESLQGTVQQLQGGYQQTTQHLTAQQQYQANEAVRHAAQQIRSFAEAKDENGSLAHPLFDDAQPYMAAIANRYKANGEDVPSIDQLYQEAVWGNPSLRGKLQAAESKKAALAQDAERIRKAAKAKRAGSSVSGAPVNRQMADDGDADIRSIIAKQFEQAAVAGDRIN